MSATQDLPRFLTEKDVASLLGLTVSALRRWRRERRGIRFVKVERAVRYERQDVLDYIERQKQPVRTG